jgi:predicted transcriptional regulator
VNVEHILASKGREVCTITPEATVSDALHRMRDEKVGALVVSADGARIAGIVSDRGIMWALADHGTEVPAPRHAARAAADRGGHRRPGRGWERTAPVTAPPITPEQCRRAREVLDWTPFDLAVQADVRIAGVLRFEAGQGSPMASRIAALRRTFEGAGVVFLADGSVRLEAPTAA